MRYELKSIGVWAYIKVSFFLNLIIGFGLGLFYGIITGILLSLSSRYFFMPEEVFEMPTEFPLGIYIILIAFTFSIGTAVFGTLLGAIFTGIYNLIVRLTGGFEVVLKPITLAPVPAPIAAQTQMTPPSQSFPIQTTPPPPPPVFDSPPTPAPPAAEPPQPSAPPQPPEPPGDVKEDDDKYKPPDSGGY